MRHVLLTGAAGFAGSHCLRHILRNTGATVAAPVSMDHKGTPERIAAAMAGFPAGRVQVIPVNLAQPLTTLTCAAFGNPDVIINYAAESHVERSITGPVRFAANNVNLMLVMLEYARGLDSLDAFVQVSTDEVYGPCAGPAHAEWSPVVPSNPYAASKACQEALATAWWRTYGLPLLIVNSMKMFGEHAQNPEKFVPMVMAAVAAGETVTVHSSADGVVGSRCWIHARNVADGILHLTREGYASRYEPQMAGPEGEPRPARFNIVGDELTNLEMAQKIAAAMGKPLHYSMTDFHSSRPGHDLRYALDGAKMASAGWRAPVSLDDGIARMVAAEMANAR